MIRSGSPSNSPDISAMPAALSDTGPKVSSETTTPVVASMPMPVSADQVERVLDVALAEGQGHAEGAGDGHDGPHGGLQARADARTGRSVAGPVRAASAISCTGAVSVEVKYSVMRLATWARTRPATTAQATRRLWT